MDRNLLVEIQAAMDKLRPLLSSDLLEINTHEKDLIGLSKTFVNNTTNLSRAENIGKFVSKFSKQHIRTG